MSDQEYGARASTIPMVPPILALAILMPVIYAVAKAFDFAFQNIEIVTALVFAPLATWIVYGHWACGWGSRRKAILATLLAVPVGYCVASGIVRYNQYQRQVQHQAFEEQLKRDKERSAAVDSQCRTSADVLASGKWLGDATFNRCYGILTREEATRICAAQAKRAFLPEYSLCSELPRTGGTR